MVLNETQGMSYPEEKYMKNKVSMTVGVVMLLIFGVAGMSLGCVESITQGTILSEDPGVNEFEVEITRPVDGEEIQKGEEVTVEVTVKNTGDEKDTQDIEFTVRDEDGEVIHEDSDRLTLQAGIELGMSFTWTAESPGEYNFQVSSEDDVDQVDVEVVVEDVAYFGVEITSYQEEVIEGHEVIIEYEIENRGSEEDRQDIDFDVYDEDGRSIFSESERIRLSPGENFVDQFIWQTEEGQTGVFDLVVESEDDDDAVSVTVLKGAYFEVQIYEYDEEAVEGDEITIVYRVDNIGEVKGEQDIVFSVDGDVVGIQEEVQIDIGGVYGGMFTWQTDEGDVGEKVLTIASDNDETEVSLMLLKDAFFEVAIVDYSAEVDEGETAFVEFEVTNTGDVEDTKVIDLLVDGDVEDSQEITIAGGDTFYGEFEWDTEEEGDYELTIASEDDEDTVTVTVKDVSRIPGFTILLLIFASSMAFVIYHRIKVKEK